MSVATLSLADPGSSEGLAIAVAFGSAAIFSLSASLQHQAAGQAPASAQGVVGVVGFLIRRPRWQVGTFLSGVAVVLHGLALSIGAIALVQPIMIAGVVLAVVVRAGLEHRFVTGAELAAVSITALGLGGFLMLVESGAERAQLRPGAASWVLVIVAVAAIATLTYGRRAGGRGLHRVEAYALAVTAGLFFGITAGLLKVVVEQIASDGIDGAAGSWALWCLMGAGVCGVGINQRAYQVAPLSVSMPTLNVTDVFVAVAFAWLAYGQAPSGGNVALGSSPPEWCKSGS